MMGLKMQKADRSDQLQWKVYSIAICGEPVDERGHTVLNEIAAHSKAVLRLSYDPHTFEMTVGAERVPVDAFGDTFAKHVSGDIILETTTLGFVEILLCCRALRQMRVPSFDLVYVEPERYRSPRRRHLLHRRDFELSGDVPGYRAIPGYAILLGDRKPQKGIFFVGYEEARLRRAFEDLQSIQASNSAVAFGVPAFKAGWEMDSIANNIGVIREQNIRGGIHFCSAENPVAVIEILSEIHRSLRPKDRLFVAPIGTKPHGIGVALFVSQNPDVGVIYDHPRRTAGRSEKIAHWHLFSVESAGA